MSIFREKEACISGIGRSPFYRKPTVYPFNLAVDACLAAIEDAGLEVEDIDGLAMWPGGPRGTGSGSSSASLADIRDALGIKTQWHASGDGPAQFASIANAIAAIAAGYCDHVLCWRAEGERWVPMHGHAYQDGSIPSAGSTWQQWTMPYYAPSAASWIALHADHHMRQFGVSREQLASIALVQRENAALNPHAVYREPLTLEEYLSARMISSPFCLYDCDVPVDGTIAVVVSRLERARDLRHQPVRFEAVGTAVHELDSWWLRPDWPNMAMHDAAKMMWQRTDLKPTDIDMVQLYDGFSYLVVLWMEALGLVASADVGAFLEGGARIRRDGEMPLNTHGGQLSEGRLHAFGHLYEAVTQLRGHAGERQLPRAETAIAAAGGGIFGSCLLLTRA